MLRRPQVVRRLRPYGYKLESLNLAFEKAWQPANRFDVPCVIILDSSISNKRAAPAWSVSWCFTAEADYW